MVAMIFGPDVLIVVIVLFGFFGVTLWAIIDAISRPLPAWESARRSKPGWVILLAVTFFLEPLGLIFGIVYLTSVRKDLRTATYIQ